MADVLFIASFNQNQLTRMIARLGSRCSSMPTTFVSWTGGRWIGACKLFQKLIPLLHITFFGQVAFTQFQLEKCV